MAKQDKKPTPPPWGVHVFLNEAWQEDKGWIKGTVRIRAYDSRPDIALHIADCSRVITLDFDASDEDSYDIRIQKVERLRDTINEFSREALRALRVAKRKAATADAKKLPVQPF